MSTAAARAVVEPAAAATLTEGLIELIRFKPVAQADLDAMALILLDGVANMLAGRVSEPGKILSGWGVDKPDPGRRALVMGGCMHVLEVDDLHRGSVTHPGCVVIPAALALAGREEADGDAFLRAVLQGFEAVCRVGMSVGQMHYKVWHNTATCGPFGAAMAAAALLQLDDEAAIHALGNAGTQSAGLWEFLNTGAMSKHLHAGRAAEAGVVAAELAAAGFTGPPAILEGPQGLYAGACPDPDPGAVLREPGRTVAGARDLDQALAVLPAHPSRDRCRSRSFRESRCGVGGRRGSVDLSGRGRCLRPASADIDL